MTICNDILNETHRSARRMVQEEVPFDRALYTNNQNLQFLIFFELFRQTAYAMISDGGPEVAIELMEKVIDEMRELKKARRTKSFDAKRFRRLQNAKMDLSEWDLFTAIPYTGEVPDEDDEDYVDF